MQVMNDITKILVCATCWVQGDRVVRVTGRAGLGPGAGVDQLTLHTSSGRQLGPYGGGGGLQFDTGDRGPRGCYLAYISGRAGQRLDQLVLHWACPRLPQLPHHLEPHTRPASLASAQTPHLLLLAATAGVNKIVY